MLDQAVETIQVLVQTKLHRLTIHKPFGPVYVNGDLARLVQSLGNILHNAAKYTDPGGEIEVDVQESNGDLTISLVRRDKPGAARVSWGSPRLGATSKALLTGSDIENR